jgi:ion channel
MSKSLEKIRDHAFFRLLFGKTAAPILSILGVGLVYIFLMSTIDHSSLPFPYVILILALIKTIVISATTLNQLSNLIVICRSMERLLWVFGLLIGISIFSFATDYTCLYKFDPASFEGLSVHSDSYAHDLFDFFYFSIATFSTVGFGDIAPVSGIARIVVMLEIFLSFFIIVFALANIKKIHIGE